MFKWFWTIFSLGAPDLGGFMWVYSYLSMNQWPDKSWSVESDLQKKPLRLRLTQLLCRQGYYAERERPPNAEWLWRLEISGYLL